MQTAQKAAAGLAAVVLAALASAPAVAQAEDPPLPPPRPERVDPPAPAASPPPALAAPRRPPAEVPCADRLARLGARFAERPPVHEDACRVDEAVLLEGLPDGVAVKPAALMRCPVAEGLARWTLDVVLPAADQHLAAAPTAVLIGTAYECRNQRSGGKLSEHALGNGVDVMGFEFAGRAPVAISERPGETPEGAFQSAVRTGACAVFTTVLGPGSDAAHGDHLHLDMRARRGDYRICQ